MNSAILQIWIESDIDRGVIPDGCSIHIDFESLNSFTESVYHGRSIDSIPNQYEKIWCDPLNSIVSDSFYKRLEKEKSVRILEYELNNLLSLGEILIIND